MGEKTEKTESGRYPTFDVKASDVPEKLFPNQRIRFSLGTPDPDAAEARRNLLKQLRKKGEYQVLKAIADGVVSVGDVAYKFGREDKSFVESLQEIMDTIKAKQNLVGVPTFLQMVDEYVEWYGRKKAANSLRSLEPALRKLARQEVGEGTKLGDKVANQVSSDDLDHAISAMGKVSYQKTIKGYVSGMYRRAITREAERAHRENRSARIVLNPATNVEIATDRTPDDVDTLSHAEASRLVQAAEPYQLAYLLPMLHIGFRQTEVIHTRLGRDLDLERWEWKIQAHPVDPDVCGCDSCIKDGWSPKTKNSHRTLHVPENPPEIRAAIERYLALYPCREGDYLFRNPRTGELWRRWSLTADFKSLCQKAEVKYGRKVQGGVTMHALRHTCATNLIRAGVRESVVADILGDSVDEVVNTYVHLDAKDLAAGIARSPQYLDAGTFPQIFPQSNSRSRKPF